MKDQILLPEGTYYKANLHCHTTLSDGHLTPHAGEGGVPKAGLLHHRLHGPPEIRPPHRAGRRELPRLGGFGGGRHRGAHRESGVACAQVLPFEFVRHQPAQEKPADLLPKFQYGDLEGLNRYIQQMRESGFLVCYNHAYWSLQDWRDYSGLKGLFAMEIYNHGCEHDGLYGFNPQVYDEMLRAGQRLYALSTDDNHDTRPIGDPLNDSFGGFVQIAAKELTYPAVMEALQAGRFYWSQGPQHLGCPSRRRAESENLPDGRRFSSPWKGGIPTRPWWPPARA